MNRRNWLKNFTLGAAGLAAFFGGNSIVQAQQLRQRPQRQDGTPADGARRGRRTIPKYPNEHFYKDGKFDADIAKEAYRELFRYHNYAIGEAVLNSPDFWILEFGQNDFTNVGMGGIFFINDKEHGYFGHDIYLLPGQMIAQHYHLPAEDLPAKHETWQVRNGSVWTVAQGGDKSKLPFVLPESQAESTTCFDAKELKVGDIDILRNLEEPHFMMAGPEGAIVTEYASYHSGDGLRFSNPTAGAK
jgi:hypothetical protein